MTDQQLLTLALAVIIPLSLLLYSNSRITEAKETLRADIRTLSAEFRTELAASNGALGIVHADMSTLRADMRAELLTLRAETRGFQSEILAAIRELDTKVENRLLMHELEHHRA